MTPERLLLEVHPLIMSGMCALRKRDRVVWVGKLGQWSVHHSTYDTILVSEEDMAALRRAIVAGEYRWRTHTYRLPESCETAAEQSSASGTPATETE